MKWFMWVLIGVVILGGGVWLYDSHSMKQLDEQFVLFSDEVDVAQNTSRINLSSSVRELMSIRREAENISVLPWRDDVKVFLIDGMTCFIEGVQEFQGSASTTDVDVLMNIQNLFERSERYLRWYAESR